MESDTTVKSLFLALALLAAAAPASAQAPLVAPEQSLKAAQDFWHAHGASAEGRWFPYLNSGEVDLRTVSRVGRQVSVWVREGPEAEVVKATYPNADKVLTRYHFDCASNTAWHSSIAIYDADGKVLYSNSTPLIQQERRPIIPDSVGEYRYELACAT